MMRAALLLACTACPLFAQQLRMVLPAGATPGQELEVSCFGSGLKDTTSVVWFRDGIEVTAIKAERDNRVRLSLRVPADCELGTYLFALHTRRGLTRAKSFRVGPLPSVKEVKTHAQPEQAQRIDLDVTVDGRILAEQVDWFAFEATAGQVIRSEAEAVRLGFYDLDLQFEIFDPDGKMVVRSDDTPLGKADPIACFVAQQTGTYTLALRDVAYRGSANSVYRLHVGTFPRPVGLLPAGGRPGEVVEVTLVGDGVPATATLTMPKRSGLHEVFPVVDGRPTPTPVRVAVDDRPGFVEGQTPAEPSKAPCAFHGVISAAGQRDQFAFLAKKGRRIQIRVLARNLRSPLDPVLSVRDQKGKVLVSNDDGLGLDGRLQFTPPSDGTFLVAVTDHLGRGGADYFYRVEVGSVRAPASTREAVPGRRSEDLGVAVPRGRRNATIIQVTGLDSRHGITLDFASLPAGVTATPARLPTGVNVVPVVFTASSEAELGVGLATPTAAAEKGAKQRPIRHEHSFPILRVRNNQPYESRAVRALPVVVTDPMPFDIDATAPQVPLVRSGSLSLPVRITRDKGFAGTVTIRALWLPAGMSAGTLRLSKAKTAGSMPFNANSRAAVGKWPIVLTASTAVGGITRSITTTVLPFEVQEPWITAKLPRARLERGSATDFVVELAPQRAFEGTVTAELGRVPKGVAVSVPAIQLPADGSSTVKLPIRLEAAANTRVGRHRSIYMRLKITTKHGVITHTVGGGEIRVDKPLPPDIGQAEAKRDGEKASKAGGQR